MTGILCQTALSAIGQWLCSAVGLSLFPFVMVSALVWSDRRNDERKRRHRRPGHCRCGYNLAGNASGVCPECGRPCAVSPAPATVNRPRPPISLLDRFESLPPSLYGLAVGFIVLVVCFVLFGLITGVVQIFGLFHRY